MIPTLPNTLRRSPPPPCGQLIGASSHFLNESSLKDCTASNCTPQVLQRYSYVGISVLLQRRLCVPTLIPAFLQGRWHSGKASAKCSAYSGQILSSAWLSQSLLGDQRKQSAHRRLKIYAWLTEKLPCIETFDIQEGPSGAIAQESRIIEKKLKAQSGSVDQN